MNSKDALIISLLKEGSNSAYKYLFDNHYEVLCHIAMQYVHDDYVARSIVGDVIFHLWEVRETINIETSLRVYLMRSVRNKCLDHLKSKYTVTETTVSNLPEDNSLFTIERHSDGSPLGTLLERELEGVITETIDNLPETCRKVFLASRFDEKKYKEIAVEYNISVDTVKYHIKNALATLSEKLKKY